MVKRRLCPTNEACTFRRVYDGKVCCASPIKPTFETEFLLDGTLWKTHCNILEDIELKERMKNYD